MAGPKQTKLTGSPVYNLLHSQREVRSWLENTTRSSIALKHEPGPGQPESCFSVQEFWCNGEVQRHTRAMVKLMGTFQSWIISNYTGATSSTLIPEYVSEPVAGTGDKYIVILKRMDEEVRI